MTTLWKTDATVVGRVRIRRRGDMRQAIDRLLRNADLRPSRLPHSSILCIRKMQDPCPKSWWDHQRLYPPREWEQSATQTLDCLAARAVRPAVAPVPASAEAVLFVDGAELLACLTADWLKGKLHTNWWWFTLFKRGGVEPMIFREWKSAPEFVPMAIARLVAQKCLGRFLARLPEDAAEELLQSIRGVFAIPPVSRAAIETRIAGERQMVHPAPMNAAVLERSSSEELQPVPPTTPLHSIDSALSSAPPTIVAGKSMPVEPWLPEVPEASIAGLSIAKKILIAQALMLERAPIKARAQNFQQDLSDWQLWAGAQLQSQIEPRYSSDSAEPQQEDQRVPISTLRAISEEVLSTPMTPGTLPFRSESVTSREIELEGEASFNASRAADWVSPIASVESCFAGVLFLLNVALYLKLYADFTSPLGGNLELNIWDFLSLLGAEVAGEGFEEDALFELLAQLAGRTRFEPPGSHFEPPRQWTLPESWLDAFPEPFEPRKTVSNGRRQVIHPAGFTLSDNATAVSVFPQNDLTRWMSWISGYIRARLARAIGRADAMEMIAKISGRIDCTSANVDVFFSLQLHPVEIRLAGLDRDPGWIPAAGRYVAYHFQ